MPHRILVIVGHPDSNPKRLCRALADSYADGARSAGYEVRQIDIAKLDIPLLRSMEEFQHGMIPPDLRDAAEAIKRAEHIVFVFPLWLGTMPALLKAFLEQIMRPGLAFAYPEAGKDGFAKTLLKGRSARVLVTMGMPAPIYRLWYLGHGIAGMRRNILNFVGISGGGRQRLKAEEMDCGGAYPWRAGGLIRLGPDTTASGRSPRRPGANGAVRENRSCVATC